MKQTLNADAETPATGLVGRHALIGYGDPELATAIDAGLRGAGVQVVDWRPFGEGRKQEGRDLVVDPGQEAAVRHAISSLHPLGIDIFVSLPVLAARENVASYPLADWLRAIEHGLSAPFIVARSLIPPMMKRRWGRLIFIVGNSADGLDARAPAAAAVDGGLLSLMRVLSRATASNGVTANAIVFASPNDVRDVASRVVAVAADARCNGLVLRSSAS